ncbi:hypothetical protein AB0C34_16970 [Nocardia sp. NPDC049220]|uniref:hypothetical protein n=1 Tax=Nocardia sp. NPDC049220 TaxID=3155273 RepID=UPI0033C047B3
MTTTAPDWAVPGATVYELHRTTRDYRTIKTIETQVERVTADRVVLANGARYRMSELTSTLPASFHRDDPQSAARYYLLVGPNDPRAEK